MDFIGDRYVIRVFELGTKQSFNLFTARLGSLRLMDPKKDKTSRKVLRKKWAVPRCFKTAQI